MSARVPVSRLVVLGAGGQLGSDLVALRPDAVGLRRDELDVTDPSALEAVLDSLAAPLADPGSLTVVNAAAYTRVDAAEADPVAAWAVNALAVAALASACARVGARLVHVSTDYVFPGDGDHPYEPGDPVGPRGVYGASKLAGELAVRAGHPRGGYVVRTAWVYGASGANFVKTMARLERDRPGVEVVDDQQGAPTWSRDLAAALLALLEARAAPPGVYHATNSGATTWYGLARAVFAELGADPARVRPVPTSAVPRPAPRPAYSVLGDAAWRAAGLPPLRPWRDALAAAFADPVAGPALRAGR